MNEKEKKAIEIIKDEIDKNKVTGTPKEVYITDIKMLLNLLENDKKEIEELRANLEKLEVSFALGVIDSNRKAEMLKNSVSKDKIKEKIEELKKQQEENRKKFSKGIDCLDLKLIDDVSVKICINFSVRSVLEGLLEENKND